MSVESRAEKESGGKENPLRKPLTKYSSNVQ